MFLRIEIDTKTQKVIFETSDNGRILDWQKFRSLDDMKCWRKLNPILDWKFDFNSNSNYVRFFANVDSVELPTMKEVKKQISKTSNLYELEQLFYGVRNRLGYPEKRLDDWYSSHWYYDDEPESKDIESLMYSIRKRFDVLSERGERYLRKLSKKPGMEYLYAPRHFEQ